MKRTSLNAWMIITLVMIVIGTSCILHEERVTQKYMNDYIDMAYQQNLKVEFQMALMQESITHLIPQAEKVKLLDVGEFRITYYCNDCDACGTDGTTSNGSTLDNTYNSVAVDKSVIPEGSRLLINGVEYIANDVGGEINGNDIDIVIYDTPHEVVHDMGVDHYEVYIIVQEK